MDVAEVEGRLDTEQIVDANDSEPESLLDFSCKEAVEEKPMSDMKKICDKAEKRQGYS